MNPEIKAHWLAALRSGQYQQAMKTLHRKGNGYCCLGVLCDVVDPGKWDEGSPGVLCPYVGKFSAVECGRCYTSFPPSALMESVRLSYMDAQTLAAMNDRGNGFEEIARYIEEHL